MIFNEKSAWRLESRATRSEGFASPWAFSGTYPDFQVQYELDEWFAQQLRLKLPSSRDSGPEWSATGQTEPDRFYAASAGLPAISVLRSRFWEPD